MITVNDFVDILRIIREQPEWGDALRSALLSRELLEMPQTLAEFAKATERRLATLESDVAGVKESQARLEEDVVGLKAGQARLEGSVGNLRGVAYEQKVASNIGTIVQGPLGLRRVRLLKGYGAAEPMAFHDLMDAAQDRGAISDQERLEVGSADLVIQGERHLGRTPLYVVVEVSVTAADSDINRAANRSELLRRAIGMDSAGAIVSVNIDPDRLRLATEKDVTPISFRE